MHLSLFLHALACAPASSPVEDDDVATDDTSTTRIHYVFATSAKVPGDFGGVEAADIICAGAAAGALLGGTSWRAWLSDATVDAIDRIDDAGPWYTPGDGELSNRLAFNNKQGLTATPLTEISTEIGGDADRVWTGTGALGRRGDADCESWSTSDARYEGTVGHAGLDQDSGWTDYEMLTCGEQAALYCIEQ